LDCRYAGQSSLYARLERVKQQDVKICLGQNQAIRSLPLGFELFRLGKITGKSLRLSLFGSG
jgi:hypothetical protein